MSFGMFTFLFFIVGIAIFVYQTNQEEQYIKEHGLPTFSTIKEFGETVVNEGLTISEAKRKYPRVKIDGMMYYPNEPFHPYVSSSHRRWDKTNYYVFDYVSRDDPDCRTVEVRFLAYLRSKKIYTYC